MDNIKIITFALLPDLPEEQRNTFGDWIKAKGLYVSGITEIPSYTRVHVLSPTEAFKLFMEDNKSK